MPNRDTKNASQYLHGTLPEEQTRLSLLNDLLNEKSLLALSLQGGERILDVGSGLGQLTRAMARTAGPTGKVIGIERSEDQINDARRRAELAGEATLVEFRQGDAYHFPLGNEEWGTFDLAHTRFLLEHVPQPERVVGAMVRAVRPGGRVILEDDDHEILRLWPEAEGFTELWKAYYSTFDHLGNDPLIGRRLVSLLVESGATPVGNDWIFFGSCAGERNFTHYASNLIGVIQSARELVLSSGHLTATDFDDGIETLRKWSQQRDSAIWYAMAWAEGRRPEAGS